MCDKFTLTAINGGEIVVGENLKRIRKRQGLTLRAIAESVGSSIGYIHELEIGSKTPSLAMLQRLASALDVTPNELLGVGEGGEK